MSQLSHVLVHPSILLNFCCMDSQACIWVGSLQGLSQPGAPLPEPVPEAAPTRKRGNPAGMASGQGYYGFYLLGIMLPKW